MQLLTGSPVVCSHCAHDMQQQQTGSCILCWEGRQEQTGRQGQEQTGTDLALRSPTLTCPFLIDRRGHGGGGLGQDVDLWQAWHGPACLPCAVKVKLVPPFPHASCQAFVPLLTTPFPQPPHPHHPHLPHHPSPFPARPHPLLPTPTFPTPGWFGGW